MMENYKKISSLLNNINDSYFSSLYYCWWWYTSDWLRKIGIETKIREIELDILKKKFNYKLFNIKPLLWWVSALSEIIWKCFVDANINISYAQTITMKLSLRKIAKNPYVFTNTSLVGKDNKIYTSKEWMFIAYQENIMELQKRKWIGNRLQNTLGIYR